MRRLLNSLSILLVCLPAYAADEITVAANVTLTSGNVSQNQKSGDLKYDMRATSPSYAAALTLVSTNWQVFSFGGVSSNGYLWIKNGDTNDWVQGTVTNAGGRWIEVGITNAGAAIVSFGKCWNGEIGLIPLDPTAVIYLRACTNNVPVQTFLITR